MSQRPDSPTTKGPARQKSEYYAAGSLVVFAGLAVVLANLVFLHSSFAWPVLVEALLVGGGLITLGAYFLRRATMIACPVLPRPS
jgi:hypothetical protein